jgi:hypothetical protein
MKLPMKFYLLALLLVSSSAHAFFFIIPTGKIADLITGAEGNNCVTNAAKVGDRLPLADGKVGEIKSLSGTSTRCTNQVQPIRALIEPVSIPEVTTTFTYAPLPDNEPTPLNDVNRFNRAVAIGARVDKKGGYSIISVQKHTVSDINVTAEQRRGQMVIQMLEPVQGPIKPSMINGVPTLQFEIAGSYKDGSNGKFLVTLFDGLDEVVMVTLWTRIEEYEDQKPNFLAFLNSAGGLVPAAKSEIVVEGSIEYSNKKCSQMGIEQQTKRFNDCIKLFLK